MRDLPRLVGWLAVLIAGWAFANWAGPALHDAGGPVLLAEIGRFGEDFLFRAADQSMAGIVCNDPADAVYLVPSTTPRGRRSRRRQGGAEKGSEARASDPEP